MTTLRSTVLLLTCGLLAACDKPPEPPTPVPTPPRTEAANGSAVGTPAKPAAIPPVVAKSAGLAAPVAAQSEALASQAPEAKVQAVSPDRLSTEQEQEQLMRLRPLPAIPLDLRLPTRRAEHMEFGERLDYPSRPRLLPPLFVDKPAEPGPFQLNGRLITDEQEESYWDSVEGAVLQFKFRH